MYSRPRAASTVGLDQTATPEGPNVGVPTRVVPVRFGASTRYVFHTIDPSRTRTAVMLPRNVQHGYSASSERVSSHEAAGTKATPSSTAAAPVNRVASCGSTLTFHADAPVRASIEWTQPF